MAAEQIYTAPYGRKQAGEMVGVRQPETHFRRVRQVTIASRLEREVSMQNPCQLGMRDAELTAPDRCRTSDGGGLRYSLSTALHSRDEAQGFPGRPCSRNR